MPLSHGWAGKLNAEPTSASSQTRRDTASQLPLMPVRPTPGATGIARRVRARSS